MFNRKFCLRSNYHLYKTWTQYFTTNNYLSIEKPSSLNAAMIPLIYLRKQLNLLQPSVNPLPPPPTLSSLSLWKLKFTLNNVYLHVKVSSFLSSYLVCVWIQSLPKVILCPDADFEFLKRWEIVLTEKSLRSKIFCALFFKTKNENVQRTAQKRTTF